MSSIITENEAIKSSERQSLGWRIAIVFMVLGVPFIIFSSWTLMTLIQANKDVEIVRIQITRK